MTYLVGPQSGRSQTRRLNGNFPHFLQTQILPQIRERAILAHITYQHQKSPFQSNFTKNFQKKFQIKNFKKFSQKTFRALIKIKKVAEYY